MYGQAQKLIFLTWVPSNSVVRKLQTKSSEARSRGSQSVRVGILKRTISTFHEVWPWLVTQFHRSIGFFLNKKHYRLWISHLVMGKLYILKFVLSLENFEFVRGGPHIFKFCYFYTFWNIWKQRYALWSCFWIWETWNFKILKAHSFVAVGVGFVPSYRGAEYSQRQRSTTSLLKCCY